MDELSEQHREVLVLRNIENMSYDAIADRLGLSVGTVKSRIARGRERLRDLMGDDFSR
jgi:RNA polymerase sigma-70 factor (ECF subfamily)